MTKTRCLIHTVCQEQRRFPRCIWKQGHGLTADRTAAWLGGALVKILAGWPPPWFWGVWGKASPGLPSAAPTGPRGLSWLCLALLGLAWLGSARLLFGWAWLLLLLSGSRGSPCLPWRCVTFSCGTTGSPLALLLLVLLLFCFCLLCLVACFVLVVCVLASSPLRRFPFCVRTRHQILICLCD